MTQARINYIRGIEESMHPVHSSAPRAPIGNFPSRIDPATPSEAGKPTGENAPGGTNGKYLQELGIRRHFCEPLPALIVFKLAALSGWRKKIGNTPK